MEGKEAKSMMEMDEKALNIKELSEGENLVNLFAIRSKYGPFDYKAGKFFVLDVGNKSGNITAKYWGGADEKRLISLFSELRVGDIVKISGQTRFDLREKQLAIHINEKPRYGAPTGYIKKVDPSRVDISEFLPAAERDVDEMFDDLMNYVNGIENKDLKRLLRSFFEDEKFVKDFKMAPAAKVKHHNYIGGLLEHVLGVVRICTNLCEFYPTLDKDLLVTGAILHDIGKIPEYALSGSIDFSERGILVGHIVLGDEIVTGAIERLGDFPETLKLKLSHMILSHHGTREFGSPKRPKFGEAVALHHADFLDSDVKGILQRIDEYGEVEDDWTYVKGRDLDRYIYLK